MNYSNGSTRRVEKQIMDFKEERLKKILDSFELDFKKKVVINIIKNKVERGRK